MIYIKENMRGITLISLVITIIILLMLSGITISIAIDTGIINKAKESNFKKELSLYMIEMEDQFSDRRIIYRDFNEEEVDARWNGEGESNIRKYIKSIDEKYKDKLEIKKGELVYIGEKEEEIKWAEELGLDIY